MRYRPATTAAASAADAEGSTPAPPRRRDAAAPALSPVSPSAGGNAVRPLQHPPWASTTGSVRACVRAASPASALPTALTRRRKAVPSVPPASTSRGTSGCRSSSSALARGRGADTLAPPVNAADRADCDRDSSGAAPKSATCQGSGSSNRRRSARCAASSCGSNPSGAEPSSSRRTQPSTAKKARLRSANRRQGSAKLFTVCSVRLTGAACCGGIGVGSGGCKGSPPPGTKPPRAEPGAAAASPTGGACDDDDDEEAPATAAVDCLCARPTGVAGKGGAAICAAGTVDAAGIAEDGSK